MVVGGEATEFLATWQLNRLRTIHAGRKDYRTGRQDVTVLSYYWGESACVDTQFYRVESAFRETWLHCGIMPSVIVTDRPTRQMELFVENFSNVSLQIEPALVAGDTFSMSQDCNGKLADRFQTEYVMIVQNDGFPLCRGLDRFLGKWDFIGAPYVRDKCLTRLIARMFNLWTCNGGFSIRTHHICELATEYWKRKWHACQDPSVTGEDLYYTLTLLKHEWKYNRNVTIADNRSALKFSYDVIVPQPISSLPFGFHRAETFVDFVRRGWLPDYDDNCRRTLSCDLATKGFTESCDIL